MHMWMKGSGYCSLLVKLRQLQVGIHAQAFEIALYKELSSCKLIQKHICYWRETNIILT